MNQQQQQNTKRIQITIQRFNDSTIQRFNDSTTYLNVTSWTISTQSSFTESHRMPSSRAIQTFASFYIFLVEPCWTNCDNYKIQQPQLGQTPQMKRTYETLSTTLNCCSYCLPEQILLWLANWPARHDTHPIAPSMGAIEPSSHVKQKNPPTLLAYVPSRQILHPTFSVPFLL